jgi:hypothetical protein
VNHPEATLEVENHYNLLGDAPLPDDWLWLLLEAEVENHYNLLGDAPLPDDWF